MHPPENELQAIFWTIVWYLMYFRRGMDPPKVKTNQIRKVIGELKCAVLIRQGLIGSRIGQPAHFSLGRELREDVL